jgi:hypothetical protein
MTQQGEKVLLGTILEEIVEEESEPMGQYLLSH